MQKIGRTFTPKSERWANSYRDLDIGYNATFDIFVNPNSKDWKDIFNQSRRYQIPVRFVFVVPANVAYVGAVPLHAELSEQARKDYGAEQRSRIDGVIDPIVGEYSIKVSERLPDESKEAFYETYFAKKILSMYRGVPEARGKTVWEAITRLERKVRKKGFHIARREHFASESKDVIYCITEPIKRRKSDV